MYLDPDLRILLVENDQSDQIDLQRAINDQGLPYQYLTAGSVEQAREILADTAVDMVVAALGLGDGNLSHLLRMTAPHEIPLVVTARNGHERVAVQAIRGGADGYIIKDSDRHYLHLVSVTIERALAYRKALTKQRQASEQIKYLRLYDRLTGLHNRIYFEEELRRIDGERKFPFSLIVGDLNGLRTINEALGYKEGDRLLVEVGAILKNSCRPEDLIARWGGDEFIVLLPGCDCEAGLEVVAQIKDNCNRDDQLPIGISMTMGLASKKYPSQEVEEVIKEAEENMNENKLLESSDIRSSFIDTLEKTLWTRSHETEEHCQQVQEMSLLIGRTLNLSGQELDNLKLLASLHDIGKIVIPNCMLNKPGKCSSEEWAKLKKHPEIGYRLALSSPELAPIAEAILFHHEQWDGQGYPIGLKGREIPLLARIIAIVDTYCVLVNGRPYQEPITSEQAWQEIRRCAGSQFDPELVSRCLAIWG